VLSFAVIAASGSAGVAIQGHGQLSIHMDEQRRPGLTRHTIVETALRLLDQVGLDGRGSMPEEFEGDLAGAVFWGADLSGARFPDVNLTDAKISHAWLVNVDIDKLVINGIDVTAYVNERDPWYPLRAMLRPIDPEGMRAAWAALEDEWAKTITRAGHHLQLGWVQPVGQPPQRLDHRRERQALLAQRHTTTTQHPHPLPTGGGGQLLGQAGLADPGLPAQQGRQRRATGGTGQQLAQPRQFLGAADKPPGRDLVGHVGPVCPERTATAGQVQLKLAPSARLSH
jgi:hypothetical protein